MEQSQAKEILAEITNPNLTYPDYYLVPFHAYDKGNLCWQAAFEAPSATYSMGLRVWKNEEISWQTAAERLRGSFHQVLELYSPPIVNDILDLGCSVGISTITLHRYYSQRQSQAVRTVGLDLSSFKSNRECIVVKPCRDEKELSE